MCKKRELCMLLVSMVLVSMTACGKNTVDKSDTIAASVQDEENNMTNHEEGDGADREESSAKEERKINIDDIVWEVDEGISDGDRYALLNYTNNTPYTIASFEITFKEKADITEGEKTVFYSDIQKELSVKDEEIEKLKNKPIAMYAETEKVCNSGEAVTNVKCYYYRGVYPVNNMSHYKLVEPDIAMIRYIDDAAIFTVYFDFNSGEYSFESETDEAFQWAQTNLGNMVPKPDTKIVETRINNESSFAFDARGMSLQQFNDYVSECIEMGYIAESDCYDGFYAADNSEGYHILLKYDEDNCTMEASVRTPEEDMPQEADTDGEDEEAIKESANSDEDADYDADQESSDSVRPEFKEAMDSYEEFYNEYCDIMKKYAENPSDMELLTDYTNMMTKSAEMTEKFNAWENGDLNNAELEYYLDVNNRVMKKLLEVSQ